MEKCGNGVSEGEAYTRCQELDLVCVFFLSTSPVTVYNMEGSGQIAHISQSFTAPLSFVLFILSVPI